MSILLSRMSYRNPLPFLYLKSQLLIHHRDYLTLYHAGRPVAKLPCHVFGHIIDDIIIPFLAYVDHVEIARFREGSISKPNYNLPV